MRITKLAALILFFTLVTIMATHSLNSINQDIGRHLKSGEIIWETKSIYKINLFSYTEPGHPFVNHHWLSEVVFYLLNGLIGLKGFIIFKAVALASAFLIIWLGLRKIESVTAFLAMGILGSLLLLSRSDVRPEIFSYLFLAFFLFAIFRAKYQSQYKWLYALPIIQIFWTNMHIYFVLGPAVILFFLIDRLIHQKSQTKPVFKIFITTCVAILINPNFISGALTPFTILRDYGYSIVENQNIFFLTDYGIQLKDIYLFEVSLMILIISFIVAIKNGKKNLIFEFLTATAFVVLAGKMIRNFGPYAFAFTSIAAINFSDIANLNSGLRCPNIVATTKKAHVIQILLCSSLILLLIVLVKNTANNNLYQWLGSAKKFGLGIPVGAQDGVDFIKNNNIAGPVFNNFDVGSFLIWKLYPTPNEECPKQLEKPAPHPAVVSAETTAGCGVFVDGRPEAYSVEFFEKIYKPMQEDPQVWQKLSEKYAINYVFFAHTDITPWARSFLSHISPNPNWPLVYLDGSTAVFLKRVPENLELIQKLEIKK